LTEYSEPERTIWRGDPALVYRAGELEVVVLPQRGGKLASILHHGRQWLTQPQRPLLPLSQLPEFLVDGDMFGWDECAPTIDDCEVMGHRLPLHGDAWNRPWSEIGEGWLEVQGLSLPYTLRRRLSIRREGFRLDYSVTAKERMPFLWAAHPQFAATPLTQVVFGSGELPLIDIFDRGYWRDRDTSDLVRLADLPPGRSAKLFVPPQESVNRAQLVQPDGATVTYRWDPLLVPYLGVWLDRASIGPVDTVAIEPMTGYADSCAAAAAADRVLWLSPNHTVSWWLDTEFTSL